MDKSTINQSLTYVGSTLASDGTHEVSLQPASVTEVLRRALIERPGEAGALGCIWTAREEADRLATQFCRASPSDSVASASGEYHARVYELPGDRWGVVVWYDMADCEDEKGEAPMRRSQIVKRI